MAKIINSQAFGDTPRSFVGGLGGTADKASLHLLRPHQPGSSTAPGHGQNPAGWPAKVIG